MKKRDRRISGKAKALEFFIYLFGGFGGNRERCPRPVANRNTCPAQQGQLLLGRVQIGAAPKIKRRNSQVVIKRSVPVMPESDLVLGRNQPGQKSRGGAAVQV